MAAHFDIKPNTLRDYLNPNEPDWLHSKHLDIVAVLTKDHPVIARYYAALQGGFFFRPATSTDQATATSVKEFGEFLLTLGPGPLSAEQLARMRKEGNEAMSSIKAVMEAAELRAGGVTK